MKGSCGRSGLGVRSSSALQLVSRDLGDLMVWEVSGREKMQLRAYGKLWRDN